MKKINCIFKIILGFLSIMFVIAVDSFGNINLFSEDSTDITKPFQVKEFPLVLIPPSFGVRFYKNGIVFLSDSKGYNRMPSNHLSFGVNEVYYAVPDDSLLLAPVVFSTVSNFSLPSEAMSFNADFSEMYYSEFWKIDNTEKIFRAIYLEGGVNAGWSAHEQPLSFCKENFNYSHPALAYSGDFMVFASDRNGSNSGMDLFISRRKDGEWGDPEILSFSINSKGNEFYPFLDDDNNLYFSSDGLPGYGGFDIYCSIFNGLGWGDPVNLTKQINSDEDDVAFVLSSSDMNTAFYTRKSDKKENKFQLFKLDLYPKYSKLKLSDVIISLALLEPMSALSSKTDQKNIDNVKQTKDEERQEEEPEIKVRDTVSTAAKKEDVTSENDNSVISEPVDEVKKETIIPVNPAEPLITEAKKDVVVYRIQILSSTKSKGSFSVKVGGENYMSWEYFYKGAYRSTLGVFKTLNEAKIMQTRCRKSGYPQAFVVVFVNDERSLDPALYK